MHIRIRVGKIQQIKRFTQVCSTLYPSKINVYEIIINWSHLTVE